MVIDMFKDMFLSFVLLQVVLERFYEKTGTFLLQNPSTIINLFVKIFLELFNFVFTCRSRAEFFSLRMKR